MADFIIDLSMPRDVKPKDLIGSNVEVLDADVTKPIRVVQAYTLPRRRWLHMLSDREKRVRLRAR